MVACRMLDIGQIPKGFHIHHRNCMETDNRPWNLALLTSSDHSWLHGQYGRATLRAFGDGEASYYTLVTWSDDPVRAGRLLLANLELQCTFVHMIPKERRAEWAANFAPAHNITFELVDDLSDTARGAGGFGSTGA